MKFGVQLYNFRDALEKDFRGALREIAKLGFDGVEFAINFGNIEPEELAALLKELKLECAGTMFFKDALLDRENIVYQYNKLLDSPSVSFGDFCDFTVEWENIAAYSRTICDNAAFHGTVAAYHNHWLEFEKVDGVPALCKIAEKNDPDKFFFEPDVCWINRGGYDPAEFIRRYAGRIRQVHLKDIKVPDVVKETTELGNGIIDIKGAYAAAVEAGAKWVIYEQDESADPFVSAEKSLKYLNTLR
ncbi:MAG: sugar phosphate isomerase/epimerase [Lentisphaeria bacterium]|nr:sugar phosphate isomerase/epimerase [Lentisphaeria bacterium]